MSFENSGQYTGYHNRAYYPECLGVSTPDPDGYSHISLFMRSEASVNYDGAGQTLNNLVYYRVKDLATNAAQEQEDFEVLSFPSASNDGINGKTRSCQQI